MAAKIKTIQKQASELKVGDVVVVAPGTDSQSLQKITKMIIDLQVGVVTCKTVLDGKKGTYYGYTTTLVKVLAK